MRHGIKEDTGRLHHGNPIKKDRLTLAIETNGEDRDTYSRSLAEGARDGAFCGEMATVSGG